MARIYFALAFVAALATATSTETAPGYFSIEVITDPDKFYPGDSGEKFIEDAGQPRASSSPIRYHVGQLRSGDKMLAQTANRITYPSPRDVQIQLKYPAAGKGETVRFMDIVVYQSSNIGSASVVSGGIGSKHITVNLISRQTTYVDYTATVYGAGSRIIANQILFIGLVASLIFKYGTDSSLFGIF